jgi:hypothetical protein
MNALGKLVSTTWRWMATLALVMGLLTTAWAPHEAEAQGALPATASAAPESAVVFHTWNLDREGAQWEQTGELFARLGMPDALDIGEEAILEEGAESGDFTAADLDALLGGEMAFVVLPGAIQHFVDMQTAMMSQMTGTPVPAAMGEMHDATPVAQAMAPPFGVAAILLPGDPDVAWAYVERQFANLAAETGGSVQETTHGSADVLWVEVDIEDMKAGMGHDDAMAGEYHDDMMGPWMGAHGPVGLAAARAGDFIIAAPSEADATGVVDVVDGTAGSLADAAPAQAVAAELPAASLSFTYVDLAPVMDAFGPEMADAWQTMMPGMTPESWRVQTGLTISADDPGFRIDTVTVPDEGGSLEAFSVPNDPAIALAAEQAPAGTFLFQAGVMPEASLASLPYSVAQMVNAATSSEADEWQEGHTMMAMPTAEEIEEEIATASATLGFDLRADLFDLIGTEFIAFSSFPTFSMEGIGLDAVGAVSTSDPDALAETLQKLADWIGQSEPDAEVSERTIGSDTVHVVADPESAEMPALEFGVIGDRAAVGVGGGLDALVTAPTASLSDDAQYQTVMGLMPSEHSQVAYIDISQVVAPLAGLMGAIEGMDSEATPTAAAGGLENLRALGSVTFERDGTSASTTILYISEPGA